MCLSQSGHALDEAEGEEEDKRLTVSRRLKFSSQQLGDCCALRLRHSIYPTQQ